MQGFYMYDNCRNLFPPTSMYKNIHRIQNQIIATGISSSIKKSTSFVPDAQLCSALLALEKVKRNKRVRYILSARPIETSMQKVDKALHRSGYSIWRPTFSLDPLHKIRQEYECNKKPILSLWSQSVEKDRPLSRNSRTQKGLPTNRIGR